MSTPSQTPVKFQSKSSVILEPSGSRRSCEVTKHELSTQQQAINPGSPTASRTSPISSDKISPTLQANTEIKEALEHGDKTELREDTHRVETPVSSNQEGGPTHPSPLPQSESISTYCKDYFEFFDHLKNAQHGQDIAILLTVNDVLKIEIPDFGSINNMIEKIHSEPNQSPQDLFTKKDSLANQLSELLALHCETLKYHICGVTGFNLFLTIAEFTSTGFVCKYQGTPTEVTKETKGLPKCDISLRISLDVIQRTYTVYFHHRAHDAPVKKPHWRTLPHGVSPDLSDISTTKASLPPDHPLSSFLDSLMDISHNSIFELEMVAGGWAQLAAIPYTSALVQNLRELHEVFGNDQSLVIRELLDPVSSTLGLRTQITREFHDQGKRFREDIARWTGLKINLLQNFPLRKNGTVTISFKAPKGPPSVSPEMHCKLRLVIVLNLIDLTYTIKFQHSSHEEAET